MIKKILSLLTLLSLFLINAQTPGVSIFYEQTTGDTREYIEYIPGNLPIIISAPHGGVKLSGQTIGEIFYPDNDSSLPDRSCGTNERDDNTEILVREIQNEIFALTGCYAHVIINNLHRSKLDPNREQSEATCGDADAIDHWNAFHNFIDQASVSVETDWGKGLYIDLHGQSHSIPRIEAGYNITGNELDNSDLNTTSIINKSTIKNLVNINLTNLTHEQLVRGENSLGEFFQNAAGTFYAAQNYPGCGQNGTNGYRAVPSNTNNGGGNCDDTRPNGNAYFDGDFYNNRRHGSGSGTNGGIGGGGNIDGIMTEVNRRVRDLGTYNGNVFDTRPQTLVPFAKDYAAVLLEYIDVHYNDFANFSYSSNTYNLSDTNPSPTISGISGGTFSSAAGLAINASTGEINLANSSTGSYMITYSLGTCNYYTNTQSIQVIDDTPDTEAPTAPTNLAATNTTETSTDLAWTASIDNIAVTAYDIYQNATIIATVSNTNYQVTGLIASTSYTFSVIAKDATGNQSTTSNIVNITTNDIVITYCNSASTNVNDEYISNVELSTINNASGAQFYSDFTSISTTLTKESQYTITITPTWVNTVYSEGYAVWIDYNKDGDFIDPGEQVWTLAATQTTPVSGDFTIPSTANEGTTRMRVSMKYNGIPTSCETFTYGEVEDYTITIESTQPDTTAPIITLNGAATIDLFVGDSYTELGATATDNIDGDLTSSIVISGNVDTSTTGTYTITYNVSDAAGNTATQVTRTVTIATPPDTTAPVITLVGNSSINLNVGDTYIEQGATATDNTDGNLTSSIVIAGAVNTSLQGTYSVNYNVSDAAGNAATQITRTIIVTLPDTTAPVITLNGAATIDLFVGDSYTELGATATDNIDGDLTSSIVISGNVDTATIGTYTVNYNVSDAAGNAATQVTRTVNVATPPDTTVPVISLIGNATINLNVGDSYNEQGATATDNVDGDLTSSIVISGIVDTATEGSYTVNYNVSDTAGNAATQVSRTIIVTLPDTTAPLITLNGPATINLFVGDSYTELGATATDNVDGDLTSSIVISGTVDTATEGSYTINYNVNDTAGNAATQVTRTIIVSPVNNGCSNGISSFPYSEGFESNLGAWTQSSADDIDWAIDANGTPSNNTGPSSAFEGSNYIYVEASGSAGFPTKQAIINSPCFDLNGLSEATFSFKYHMFGSNDMGRIDLEISNDDGGTWASVWNKTGNQGNSWLTANINLSAYLGNNIQLRFNRITGGTWQADIAIDDISLIDSKITVSSCSEGITSFPYSQGYENTLGDWTQSSTDNLDWTVNTNETPSNNTGPSNATQGSYYIFVEASGNGTGFPNKQAIINSPCYDLTNNATATFNFNYHMYGAADMGTIALEVSNDNGVSWTNLWSESGNKGNSWLTISIDLSAYLGDSVQLRFNRITGGTWQADIAIDNVNLNTSSTTSIVTETDLSTQTLTVYPNPVKRILNIQLSKNQTVKPYKIVNVYGQVIKTGTTTKTIDISNLEAGLYYIEVKTNSGLKTERFIKD